jgi:hypothetical protein
VAQLLVHVADPDVVDLVCGDREADALARGMAVQELLTADASWISMSAS